MKIRSRAILLIALMGITGAVFSAPTVASAEETSLCQEDGIEFPEEFPCPKEKVATHIHLVSNFETQKVKLITSSLELEDTECNSLILGDTVEPSGAPLLIEAKITYTNCTNSCTVEVIEGEEPSYLKVLKVGLEKATLTWPSEDMVFAKCLFWNCYFSWEELATTYIGPYLSELVNGEIPIKEQELRKLSAKGTSCPFATKLSVRFEPLELLFLTIGAEK